MKKQIPVNYPESLALLLKMEKKEFESEMKTMSLIKLYELGKISSGLGSKMLGISRVDFLEMLSKYGVSYINQGIIEDLETDFKNA
jgi:predicted HTH domain antitoxin